MSQRVDREIYIKASRSFELLSKSVQIFEDYLKDCCPSNDPEYYRAKNFLKEGESVFQELFMDTKKLLGPLPAYAAKEAGQWRTQLAEEIKLVARGENPDALHSEFSGDAFLTKMFTPEEISAYIRDSYETQRTGKRKLANFKARMILDKLLSLIHKSQELQKIAQKKQQGKAL